MKAWITYSYGDKEFVERLKNSFDNTVIEFQEIEHEILPGENIVETIYKRISQSEIIFVILSKEGVERKWFSTELGILISEIRNNPEKKIFPILKDKDVIIPPFVDQYQFVDLSDNKTFDKNIELLQRALNSPKEKSIDLYEREIQQKNIIQSKYELLEREKYYYEKKKKEKQKILYLTTILTVIASFITLFVFIISNEKIFNLSNSNVVTSFFMVMVGAFLGALISLLINKIKEDKHGK